MMFPISILMFTTRKLAMYISICNQEEVFGIHDSEDDEDELPEPLGEEMDSDIEGKDEDEDRLPDSKAWGSRKGVYYKTDYVDEDYGGNYNFAINVTTSYYVLIFVIFQGHCHKIY